MAISGAQASYYIHRGGHGGSSPGSQIAGLHAPPGFRPNNNAAFQQAQSNVRATSVGSTFSAEPSRPNYPHGISMSGSPGAPSSEPVKKKRGRPRKYGPGLGSGKGQGPDAPVSLALSPLSSTPNPTPGSTSPTPKRNRGRPPGTGRKQQLANLGKVLCNI